MMKNPAGWLLLLPAFLTGSCENPDVTKDPNRLSVEFQISHVRVFGGSDGEIHTMASGGMVPYNYNWDHGSDQADLYGLSAGVYYLLLTDSTGNSLYDSAIVTQPEPLMLMIQVQHCSSDQSSDGAIDVTISGGVPPYSITWSTGDKTEDISGLSPGEFVISVQDVNGALESDTVSVEGTPVTCRDTGHGPCCAPGYCCRM
jgi:hypothetical protein